MRLHHFISLAGLFFISSCNSMLEPGSDEASVEITFSIGDDSSKATGIADSDESRIDHWAIVVFNTDNPSECYRKSSSSAGSISLYVSTGKNYRAHAIANYPIYGTGYFDPWDMTDEDSLALYAPDLSGIKTNALMMYGAEDLNTLIPNTTVHIGLTRLVSKVGIRKITLGLSDPNQAARAFTIRRIYLTNVFRGCFLSRDFTSGEILADDGLWYNAGGWHSSGTFGAIDALTCDASVNASLANGASYSIEHSFYCFPNTLPPENDSRDATWSPRHTRLVIEAEVGSRTYYYPVTIPAMERNNTYIITEATIRNLGSTDPEQEIPGAIDVSFSSSPANWEGNYSITEQS